MDVGPFLPGHYTGCPTIWLRDMGGDPPHWDSPGGVLPPVGTEDYGESTTSMSCQVVPLELRHFLL